MVIYDENARNRVYSVCHILGLGMGPGFMLGLSTDVYRVCAVLGPGSL